MAVVDSFEGVEAAEIGLLGRVLEKYPFLE
jgi:hypothetical protein